LKRNPDRQLMAERGLITIASKVAPQPYSPSVSVPVTSALFSSSTNH
jgi:hypothetical protein